MTSRRIYADNFDQASAKVWDKHPLAVGVTIKYLYCGWYEYMVLE